MTRLFEPDWTLHPGVALREIMDVRGISEAGLADLARLGPETIAGILDCTLAIDGLIAQRLEEALGGPSAQFWLNYQANYERDLARGAKDVSMRDLDGKDEGMAGGDAAARAAGVEVTVLVRLTHRDQALLELPGEEELVRWPAAEVAAAAGVDVRDLPGVRLVVTVRETPEEGRVLSGFRLTAG